MPKSNYDIYSENKKAKAARRRRMETKLKYKEVRAEMRNIPIKSILTDCDAR